MTTTTMTTEEFLQRNPTLIGNVLEYKYYEDPDYGEDAYLWIVTPNGLLEQSEFLELPTTEEHLQTLWAPWNKRFERLYNEKFGGNQ